MFNALKIQFTHLHQLKQILINYCILLKFIDWFSYNVVIILQIKTTINELNNVKNENECNLL